MVKIFFYFSEGLTFYCFCIKVLPFEKSLGMKGKTFRILLYSSTMFYYNKGKTFRILLTKEREEPFDSSLMDGFSATSS